MSRATLKSLCSPKLIRNILLLCGLLLAAVLAPPPKSQAELSWVVGANCNNFLYDASFPGAICAVAGYCGTEDSLPVAASWSWGNCPNNSPTVINHAKSYGTVGGMAIQAQSSNTTVFFSQLSRNSETAFCNGNVNTEHVPFDVNKCNILNPPRGLPPNVCYASYCWSWDPDLFPGWGGGGGEGGGGGDGGGGDDDGGGGGGCDYCAGNWYHDAECASPYDTNVCGY